MRLTESLITEFTTAIESLTLIPSGGGVFDVRVNDEVIFSKHSVGRFPTADEIKPAVRSRV